MVAVLAGCTGGDAEDPAASASSSPASGVGVVSVGDGDAIVELTARGANGYDGSVQIEVQSLTVEGRTMELRVALTPLGGDEEEDDGTISAFSVFDGMPVLSDVERLTQYHVVGGANERMRSDMTGVKTLVGEPMLFQAWFPAPHEDVEVLDLVLDPAWPSFTDVPVTRS